MITKKEQKKIAEFCNKNPDAEEICAIFNRERQYTLSKISHEIRNPVALIDSFLQLMKKEHPEINSWTHFQKIQENMEALEDLLEDLSSYNNAKKLHLDSINLYRFLQVIMENTASKLRFLPIETELQKNSAIPSIPLDISKMRQVMSNLIRNAVESMPDGGKLTLAIHSDGSDIFIKVSDTGCGIEDDKIPTLFEPFVTHKPSGTGLGLAIAREVIEAHEGTIGISSVPKQGTTFTVKLPIR